MLEFQHGDMDFQHGDQEALMPKTIAYEPSVLKDLNTANQHDYRLKILPFGAIKTIRKLRINHKRKSKHKKRTRIIRKQHGINCKNLTRVKKEGIKTPVNFTIATCNVQSLRNKELQVSELIHDYSIDAIVLTEAWLNNKDKHWKDVTELNKHNLQLLTSDRQSGRGGGIALITRVTMKPTAWQTTTKI